MTIFTLIVLVMFVSALVLQFVTAIEQDCLGLTFLFAFEILAFAYLAKILM